MSSDDEFVPEQISVEVDILSSEDQISTSSLMDILIPEPAKSVSDSKNSSKQQAKQAKEAQREAEKVIEHQFRMKNQKDRK